MTLKAANTRVARDYPGDRAARQPIHTVYGGAPLFTAETAPRFGALAIEALDAHAPDGAALAGILDLPAVGGSRAAFGDTIRALVVDKLRREPIEDYRLDYEDGYGQRSDAEEDGHARSGAEQVAAAHRQGTLPPFVGIRIKSLSQESQARSLRTLDLFVSTLAKATRRRLPPNFAVTIPKLMTPAHVTAVARACRALERRHKLRPGTIQLELMIETPQSILAPDGSVILRALVAAGEGRVRGAHFGTYDYTALSGITAAWQHMRHPACDFAKHMMQVALAQSGVWLSDGATNILPGDTRESVHRAWKTQYDDIQHSLVTGFYQGWDLHPAQLPVRYAAFYAFFRAAQPNATARLRQFRDKQAQASVVGGVFDDAATVRALENFFARGVSAGALTAEEARAASADGAE